MKKINALVIALSAVFMLASCGSKQEETKVEQEKKNIEEYKINQEMINRIKTIIKNNDDYEGIIKNEVTRTNSI